MKRFKHDYEELQKVASKYYGDTNCCGVICLAATAQIAYGKAKSLLENKSNFSTEDMHSVAPGVWDREFRGNPALQWDGGERWWTRTHDRKHKGATSPTKMMALGAKLGFTVERIDSPAKTLGQALKRLPKDGAYWVWTSRHVTALIDGEVVDWSDGSSRHKVRATFKITRHY